MLFLKDSVRKPCEYCYFWKAVSENRLNIIILHTFTKQHGKCWCFRMPMSKQKKLNNTVYFTHFPKSWKTMFLHVFVQTCWKNITGKTTCFALLLEHRYKYCYFWTAVSENLLHIAACLLCQSTSGLEMRVCWVETPPKWTRTFHKP